MCDVFEWMVSYSVDSNCMRQAFVIYLVNDSSGFQLPVVRSYRKHLEMMDLTRVKVV